VCVDLGRDARILGGTPFCEDVVAVEWGPWCDTYAPGRPAAASYMPQVRRFKEGSCDDTVVFTRQTLLEALRGVGIADTLALTPPIDLVAEDGGKPTDLGGKGPLKNWKLSLKDSAVPPHSHDVYVSYVPESGGRDNQIHVAGHTFHVRSPLRLEKGQFVLSSL
jgi:hypothetical protein